MWKFRKIEELRLLEEGRRGGNEMRCAVRHGERSLSPSNQEAMCSRLQLNKEKRKHSMISTTQSHYLNNILKRPLLEYQTLIKAS